MVPAYQELMACSRMQTGGAPSQDSGQSKNRSLWGLLGVADAIKGGEMSEKRLGEVLSELTPRGGGRSQVTRGDGSGAWGAAFSVGMKVSATVQKLAGPGYVLGHETGGVAGSEDPILGIFGWEP